ncbi:Mo-dependent nitrogenase [Scytonema hofmannii PCC 7110]|uniref:Mo-dependent nitrogenase n=1 Tax=Scytonema hofmannii PCC 7110 TaxID=128403 RepID=A0A139X158_9CYAN|nr:Mo-dependent nitrogenase C-terminal domain-containing protein [Scytonema hofmannii]KYC38451.1 Mo-dependent nitrogenase [Scytonema hofmannii PCC 7110]
MLGTNQIKFIQNWLDTREIHNPTVARFLCKLIPAQCPFERKLKLFNRVVLYIPPLCNFNPFYYQLINLRFRCLSCLVDEYGEDVTIYL